MDGALIVVFLSSVLIGYIIGRARGRREGGFTAEQFCRLELKIDAYETGRCPVCGGTREPILSGNPVQYSEESDSPLGGASVQESEED